MKNILYATDYSKHSVSALRLAHLFAMKFKARLTLLHVFDVPLSVASPMSVTYMKKEKRLFVEHRQRLEEFYREHVLDSNTDVDVHFMVDEDGAVWNGILEKADEMKCDLTVIGTHSQGNIKSFLMGSTTKALIQRTACPVLAVPPEWKATTTLKTFLYATDFEQADIYALNALVKIAQRFNATIKVLHVTTKNEYAGDQQMEWFKEMLSQKVTYKKIAFNLIFSDDIPKALARYLKDSGSDLMVMLEREPRGVLKKWFHRDTVLHIEEKITVPLLTYASQQF